MTTTATLAAIAAHPLRDEPSPVVWIQGRPEPRLEVLDWTAQGPLDLRSATLQADPNLPSHDWRSQDLLIATPLRLVDGSNLLEPHLFGRVEESQRDQTAKRHRQNFTLIDHGAATLDDPVPEPLSLDAQGNPIDDPAAAINFGPRANRSPQPIHLPQGPTYLPQSSGETWTFAQAVQTLGRLASIQISLKAVPLTIQQSTITERLPFDKSLGDLLEDLLTPYGLSLRQELTLNANLDVTRRWRVIPLGLSQAGAVDQHLAAPTAPATRSPSARTVARQTQRAQQWIARAQGVEIESTFELTPAWDPADQDLPNNAYSRNTNPDFSQVSDVFRLWVLNEDAAQPGPAFDLPAFFGEKALPPGPLRFRDSITLTASGQPMPPAVEVSVNAGVDWTAVSDSNVSIRATQAAVYFSQTTLSSGWIEANRNGQARLRVTATLRSPAPRETARWQGNPLVGADPPRVFDFGDAFRVRRVDPASRNAPAVAAGNLPADTRDDSPLLAQALVERLDAAQRLAPDAAVIDLTLHGLTPALHPGDRVRNAGGPRLAPDGDAQTLSQLPAIVDRVTRRIDQAQTQLRLRA